MTRSEVKRVVGYVRVSREEQVKSGLGLEAQKAAIQKACKARGWKLIEVCADEGVSGAVLWADRPGLARALSFVSGPDRQPAGKSRSQGGEPGLVQEGQSGLIPSTLASPFRTPLAGPIRTRSSRPPEADGLIVAKLDRLTRSLFDFADLTRKAEREGWALSIVEPDFDLSTPSGKAMVGILAVFAEMERDLIKARTREALAALKARGVTLGRPARVTSGQAILMVDLRNHGLTYRQVATYLNQETDFLPPDGGMWRSSTVAAVIKRWLRPPPEGPILWETMPSGSAWSGQNVGFRS